MSSSYFDKNGISKDVLVPLLIALMYVILVLLYIISRCCQRNRIRDDMLVANSSSVSIVPVMPNSAESGNSRQSRFYTNDSAVPYDQFESNERENFSHLSNNQQTFQNHANERNLNPQNNFNSHQAVSHDFTRNFTPHGDNPPSYEDAMSEKADKASTVHKY